MVPSAFKWSNEFAAVASRKLSLSWGEIKDIRGPIRAICQIDPVSIETHGRAIEIAGRHGFSFYESAIVASALHSGCRILYSEDFQHGQLIASQLRIRNPFMSA